MSEKRKPMSLADRLESASRSWSFSSGDCHEAAETIRRLSTALAAAEAQAATMGEMLAALTKQGAEARMAETGLVSWLREQSRERVGAGADERAWCRRMNEAADALAERDASIAVLSEALKIAREVIYGPRNAKGMLANMAEVRQMGLDEIDKALSTLPASASASALLDVVKAARAFLAESEAPLASTSLWVEARESLRTALAYFPSKE